METARKHALAWGVAITVASFEAAAPVFADVPEFREINCRPVAGKVSDSPRIASEGATIGPVLEGPVEVVSYIRVKPASPHHYSAEGKLHLALEHKGIVQSIDVEVTGNYYDFEEDHSSFLRPVGNPQIGVIHLDFKPNGKNGSFIETLAGPMYLMDCGQPEYFSSAK